MIYISMQAASLSAVNNHWTAGLVDWTGGLTTKMNITLFPFIELAIG